ncbi:hypothetical protein GCM10028895_23970 [Pontibacter rugosus]
MSTNVAEVLENAPSRVVPKGPDKGVIDTFFYDNKIVRDFGIATVFWGIAGMLIGVIIAFQLANPDVNMGNQYTTFGRVRPLHTNAVIFAFVGNAIFMGVYYSLQRLCKTRMYSDLLSKLNFWGWQLIIVAAVITLPLGITTSKEYASWSGRLILLSRWYGWYSAGTCSVRLPSAVKNTCMWLSGSTLPRS